MTGEKEIIERLRTFARHPAALGLLDDAALFEGLVLTHDTLAEGVHFLPGDPPASVGWKLVAVNLSDLAAKGARPAVALLSYTMAGDRDWDLAFLEGVEAACESYSLALVGGDTIALPSGAPRVLGLTAIGKAGDRLPHRGGGKDGDGLWLVGNVGDSAAGLDCLKASGDSAGPLVDIYRRPVPQVAAGEKLARVANAMMDVSDGLLMDAGRLAEASGLAATIDLDSLPLSKPFIAERGNGRRARLFAATGGDDYALLAAIPEGIDPLSLSLPSGTRLTRVGSLATSGPSLSLTSGGREVQLPERLGYEHRSIFPSSVGDRL